MKAFVWMGALVTLAPGLGAGADGEPITVSRLREHVRYLASPELAGRKPGQPGYRLALDYAAERFRAAGLEPVYEDDQGRRSFLQPVPLVRYRSGPANKLVVRRRGQERTYAQGGNTYFLSNPGNRSSPIPAGQPVFVGCGIHESAQGWDDYATVDVRGRLVILLDGIPDKAGDRPIPAGIRRQYSAPGKGAVKKLRTAFGQGAAGIIVVPGKRIANAWNHLTTFQQQYDFSALEDYSDESLPEPPGPILIAHPNLVKAMFSGRDYDPVSREGPYRTFVVDDVELELTLDVTREPFHTYNLVGVARGSDGSRERGGLVLSAHLDHLGSIDGRIFPGANDDASGCAAVLEVARAVAQKPPDHSVLFVLFGAEEAGRLGSLHFLAHPPAKVSILLNVNLDQIGRKPLGGHDGFWAFGPAGLGSAVYASIGSPATTGVVFERAEAQMQVFGSGDNYSFYSRGIPALLLTTGGFAEYHGPGDEARLIDFEHLHRAALVAHNLVMRLGPHALQ